MCHTIVAQMHNQCVCYYYQMESLVDGNDWPSDESSDSIGSVVNCRVEIIVCNVYFFPDISVSHRHSVSHL